MIPVGWYFPPKEIGPPTITSEQELKKLGPYVAPILYGGLGNVLFQLAAVHVYAQSMGVPCVVGFFDHWLGHAVILQEGKKKRRRRREKKKKKKKKEGEIEEKKKKKNKDCQKERKSKRIIVTDRGKLEVILSNGWLPSRYRDGIRSSRVRHNIMLIQKT